MINSVALANTALTIPPSDGPVTTATFSVAVPNQIYKGIMAREEVTKTAVSPQCKRSAMTEMGTKMRRIRGIAVLSGIGIRLGAVLILWVEWH